MDVRFENSKWEIQRSCNALTEAAWVKAAEIIDFLEENDVDTSDIDSAVASLDQSKLTALFWNFYAELALCALDRGNLFDLTMLSMLVMPWARPSTIPAFEIQGRNLGVFVDSMRQDNDLPGQLAGFVEKAGNAAYYSGLLPARSVVPSEQLGKLIHSHLFRKTQDLHLLNLDQPNVFLHSIALPFALAVNFDDGAGFKNRDEAVAKFLTYIP